MRSNTNKSTISNRLFNEQVPKNVKKSAKDYFIYFFTLMLSVCLFYSFKNTSTQFALLVIAYTLIYLAFSSSVLTVSVLVYFVMRGLVIYANCFLLRRRKKEMGIYVTLGMERKDLNKLLMKETHSWNLFCSDSLSCHSELIGLSLTSYNFKISIKGIFLSILFFEILFFFVHLFNIKELKKMSLLDMLYADRRNETVTE